MQNPLPKYTLLIISISSPLLLGVYKDNRLHQTISSEKKISEILLVHIQDILEKYSIDRIIYTRGPGSYMAIKLTYLMLKTIEIIRDIPCFGCSGFTLNNAKPIKAIGNLYFIKEKETIITKKYAQPIEVVFYLPECIENLEIDDESIPAYSLPAV